jgi:hypothetical protein
VLRSRLTYANVVATLALFVALGGSSYAALTITGRNVRNSSLTGKDVKNNSLTGSDVKRLKSGDVSDGSLLAKDFKAGQLPAGAKGDKGDKGDSGAPATRLFAQVTSSGNLAYGSGATGASRSNNGTYDVQFDRSLDGCVGIAATGYGKPVGVGETQQAGSAAVVDMSVGGTNGVEVLTTNGDGTAQADRSFHLAVFC